MPDYLNFQIGFERQLGFDHGVPAEKQNTYFTRIGSISRPLVFPDWSLVTRIARLACLNHVPCFARLALARLGEQFRKYPDGS